MVLILHPVYVAHRVAKEADIYHLNMFYVQNLNGDQLFFFDVSYTCIRVNDGFYFILSYWGYKSATINVVQKLLILGDAGGLLKYDLGRDVLLRLEK